MILQTNTPAPVFSLKDIYGRQIDLNNYRNNRVLIGFFRHAGCPFCNLRVHALTKVHETLKNKGFEMIFFFESKENVILRSTFHQGVSPIPIISDPLKTWYKNYGLEGSTMKSIASHLTNFAQTAIQAKKENVPIHLMKTDESFSTMPAEFLLDRELIIKKTHYSERLNDRFDVKEIFEFAES